MKAAKLFKIVVSEFPPEIDISDGVSIPNGGYLFENFNKICDDIVDQHITNPWLEIGCWSFSQVLWTKAVELLLSDFNSKLVKAADVDFAEFNQAMLSNLQDESWEKERLEFDES